MNSGHSPCIRKYNRSRRAPGQCTLSNTARLSLRLALSTGCEERPLLGNAQGGAPGPLLFPIANIFLFRGGSNYVLINRMFFFLVYLESVIAPMLCNAKSAVLDSGIRCLALTALYRRLVKGRHCDDDGEEQAREGSRDGSHGNASVEVQGEIRVNFGIWRNGGDNEVIKTRKATVGVFGDDTSDAINPHCG